MCAAAGTAAAQEAGSSNPVPLLAATDGLPAILAGVQPPTFGPVERVIEKAKRPPALLPLYGSLAMLQALDIHSTGRALSTGNYREANPLMSGVVGNKAAFVAVKVAATTSMIVLTEKLWKKHRVGAVVFAVAANAAMAIVVGHNYRARQ